MATDFPVVTSMLSDAGLPVADFVPDHLVFVAAAGRETVGAIGYEHFGDTGLLRSLIVADRARGRGIGRRLVSALEAFASESGVAEIWLLTIDANPFFGSLGYVVRDRDQAPSDIRGTAEFAGLCPGDAVLMSKRLAAGQESR